MAGRSPSRCSPTPRVDRSCPWAKDSENLRTIVTVDEGRRWRWGRRWRGVAVPDVLSDIALAEVDVPVGVADTFVPNHWIRDVITGVGQLVSRTPVTRPFVRLAAWPRVGICSACGEPESSHAQTG